MLAKQFYADSISFRFQLEALDTEKLSLEGIKSRWIDPGLDGMHSPDNITPTWHSWVRQFPNVDEISKPRFHKSPSRTAVQEFVKGILDACVKHKPEWITVPQFPVVEGSERNRINRLLSEYAHEWKIKSEFTGQFILPIIFTHQEQTRLKQARTPTVKLAKTCYDLAGARGIWVVDQTLVDSSGSKTLEQRRLPALISFQQEITDALPGNAFSVVGPYWGLNLVLWAKGLADYPAIGLGGGYQYHLPGGLMKPSKTRIALPSLRRMAVASTELKTWLRNAKGKLSPSDKAFKEFERLETKLDRLMENNVLARQQLAKFYKEWYDKIDRTSPTGRNVGLFQDLSSAYVTGKALPNLPKDESPGRQPDSVARQLMLFCL